MINSYQNSQNIEINAVGGTIVKNYKDSFFVRFHMKSILANELIGTYPNMDNTPVVVLQVMLCGDGELIAEVMWKDDFDRLFDTKKKER